MRKIIDLNKQENIEFRLYPDNQPHINIKNINEGDEVTVICSLTDSNRLLMLLECADAIDTKFAIKRLLVIPYLMGARFDRVMKEGDSFDLRVIAKLINSLNFSKIILYDPHSDVSAALIKNSITITNKSLVEKYDIPNSILICPDAGASKKMFNYMQWNSSFVDIVYCNKHRNLSNGQLSIEVIESEKCTNRLCAIIDDLCDGGGTFLGIAVKATYCEVTKIIDRDAMTDNPVYETECREIFKDPVTDDGTKKSAKGLISIGMDKDTKVYKLYDQVSKEEEKLGYLKTVFRNGEILISHSLSDIRKRLGHVI